MLIEVAFFLHAEDGIRDRWVNGVQTCELQILVVLVVFFFKQKTAYELCGRDWSSDVCSPDLNI